MLSVKYLGTVFSEKGSQAPGRRDIVILPHLYLFGVQTRSLGSFQNIAPRLAS
jgi:hypothetical protein